MGAQIPVEGMMSLDLIAVFVRSLFKTYLTIAVKGCIMPFFCYHSLSFKNQDSGEFIRKNDDMVEEGVHILPTLHNRVVMFGLHLVT